MDLGLDISSSITGIVLLDTAGNLVFMNHVPLTSTKYKNLFDKADAVLDWMKKNLPPTVQVRRIFVEANAMGYSMGKTTAQTLFVLAKMNVLVSYLTSRWLQVPLHDINVISARSRIGYKDNKQVKKPAKEKAREFVLATHPNLPFKTRVLDRGKNKGATVPVKGCEDEIDAYIICRGGQLIVGA